MTGPAPGGESFEDRLLRILGLTPPDPAAPRPVRHVSPAGDDDPRLAVYLRRAIEGEQAILAAMPEGGRNHQLNKSTFKLAGYVGGGSLDEQVLREAMREVGLSVGLTRRETWLTVDSGIKGGIERPKVIELDDEPSGPFDPAADFPGIDEMAGERARFLAHQGAGGGPGPPGAPDDRGGGGGGQEPDPEPLFGEPLTDLGNARRLVAAFGDRIRHVGRWNQWLVWDGRRWAEDDTGEVWRLAKRVARGMLHDAASAPDKATRDALVSASKRAESAVGLGNMIKLASTEAGVAVQADVFDADPWLLNVANGVVDLRTGELGRHDPALMLTKITKAAYRPDTELPEWTKFLERVQPEPVMREFLARLFGYGLLGSVTEHILPIFYGTGQNGKSTMIDTIMEAMGDYAGPIDPELLVESGTRSHPAGIAALFGLRLAITHETDEGRRLAEGTVKRLTGGDRITARRMRENFWSFDPAHLPVMLTNHRPVIRGNDEGIWRRLLLVPFGVSIPESERDPALPQRLALEIDGVLSWMIHGYAEYASAGLNAPDQVRVATSEYRTESDDLNRFIEEDCAVGSGMVAISGQLFAAWVAWCDRQNTRAGSQTKFSRTLTDRGFTKITLSGGKRAWSGIALSLDDDDE